MYASLLFCIHNVLIFANGRDICDGYHETISGGTVEFSQALMTEV
jgi:hypothetical protein